MKAQIKTYQTNATIWYDNEEETAYLSYDIDWDGMDFDTAEEYADWITGNLSPIEGADNYEAVRRSLEIATDYLCPSKNTLMSI